MYSYRIAHKIFIVHSRTPEREQLGVAAATPGCSPSPRAGLWEEKPFSLGLLPASMRVRLPLFLLPIAAALPGVPPAPEPTLPPADPIHRNVLLAWNMMYGWAPLISAEHPYTDHEREGLRQARAMQELPEETRLEVELEIAIRNAQDIRNREHYGRVCSKESSRV